VRHGGDLIRTELTDRIEQSDKPLDELLALDAALGKVARMRRSAGGTGRMALVRQLPLGEIARVRVEPRTVKRHWSIARVSAMQSR
jgi:hypothetical protein